PAGGADGDEEPPAVRAKLGDALDAVAEAEPPAELPGVRREAVNAPALRRERHGVVGHQRTPGQRPALSRRQLELPRLAARRRVQPVHAAPRVRHEYGVAP